MKSHFVCRFVFCALALSGLSAVAFASAPPPSSPAAPAETAKWYKGNLHAHSLWSDGDDYPEMVADWYKKNGYHFLAISDGNILHQGTRWHELKAPLTVGGYVNHR